VGCGRWDVECATVGWVEGVVTVVTGLAWPVVVLVVVLVLRGEIGKLITRLTRFSGGGVEAEFQQQVEAVSALASAIAPDTPQELPRASQREASPLQPDPALDDLVREAEAHPVGAMVRAWNMVEARTDMLVASASSRPPSAAFAMKDLRLAGNISEDLYQLGRRLADLRNRVVHGEATPTRDDAREFVTAAWRLASELSRTDPLPR
jgi:hypothetical protein